MSFLFLKPFDLGFRDNYFLRNFGIHSYVAKIWIMPSLSLLKYTFFQNLTKIRPTFSLTKKLPPCCAFALTFYVLGLKPNYFKKQSSSSLLLQVQNGNGMLDREVSCLLKTHGTSLLSTPGKFGPILLPYLLRRA